jgi:hypothetical protein
MNRPQKISFAEMRASGVRGLLIYCSDYQCSHWIAISGDRWPADVRLSDLEPRFTRATSPEAKEHQRHFEAFERYEVYPGAPQVIGVHLVSQVT